MIPILALGANEPIVATNRVQPYSFNFGMKKRKFIPPKDIPKETQAMAEKLASVIGGNPKDYRHAEYRHHNGYHWTVESRWERLIDGEWTEVPWTAIPSTDAANSKHYD